MENVIVNFEDEEWSHLDPVERVIVKQIAAGIEGTFSEAGGNLNTKLSE